MKNEITHSGHSFRVTNAAPNTGESMVMGADLVRPDGSLRPLPFLGSGSLLAVDGRGENHSFRPGDIAAGIQWPQAVFSVVAQEPSDYWCISPEPGLRITPHVVRPVLQDEANPFTPEREVYAVFTQDVEVSGAPVQRGRAVRLSPRAKNVTTKFSGAWMITFEVSPE